MRRAAVDFPQPDSPTMPSVVPAFTVKESPSTAETAALEKAPVRTGKVLLTFFASSRGGVPPRPSVVVASMGRSIVVIASLLAAGV